MKKKILLIIAGGFIAGIAMINTKIELAERNMNVSISDISVMALADGESGGLNCASLCPNPGLGCIIKYENGTMETCPDAHT